MADKTLAIRLQIEGNKQLQDLGRAIDNDARALKQLNKRIREGKGATDLDIKAKNGLTASLKANRNAYRDNESAILRQNKALRKNSGFVAGVKKGVGQWATSMIGVTIAIAGVTKLVGSAVKIFKDFEEANSKLAAVTRASANEMKIMSDQAKELGGTTAFTASEVTGLQIEFAKLGFPTQEIVQMTDATLAGAAALGSGLGEQAALTGALLKQYGLDASEAGRVNDVLAESAASSALDFSKLSTALPIVGATANAVGVDLQETTAILGTLSDRGLDASTAGTSLRNVFLELSKQGLTMDQAMNKINNSTDKAKTSMELFGKRGATTGLILAETGESVGLLEDKLRGADGAAQDMADTMLDNLAGDITKAQSAWEGFILSMEDGEGSLASISRSSVGFFTGVLQGMTRAAKSFDQNLLADINEINKGFSKNLEAQIADNIKNKEVESKKELAILRSRVNRGIETEEQFAEKRKKIEDDLSKFKENAALNALKNEAKEIELTNKKILKDTEFKDITLENAKEISEANQQDFIAKTTGLENRERGEKRTIANSILINQNRLEKLKQIIKQEEDANKLKNEKELNDKIVLEENLAKEKETQDANAKARNQKEIDREKAKNEKIADDKIAATKKLQDQLDQLNIDSIANDREREESQLRDSFKRKIDAIVGNSELEKELKFRLAEELHEALNEQKAVFREEDELLEQERLTLKKEVELETEMIQAEEDLVRQNEILNKKRALELQNENLTIQEKALINAKYNKQVEANEAKITQFKKDNAREIFQQAANLAGALSSLAKEGSEEAKAAAIVQAGINGALAITQALAQLGPIAGALAAVGIGITTGIQIANISSAKFEDGGVLQGSSHANGGIPFTIGGQSGFEAEGGEAIINKRSTAMFGDLLSDINQAGGGVAFARGGIARKFQGGGALPNSQGVTASQQRQSIESGMGEFAEQIIEGINDKEVINVSTNTTNVAQDVMNIAAEATF